jgi:hypothetical protein
MSCVYWTRHDSTSYPFDHSDLRPKKSQPLSNARPREAEAELVLVSRAPDARRAADVVGVVTPAALAHLLKTDEELL